ncbi:MAG: hypothetical protein MJ072_03250, partial [Clostridia bacterium]|nr:hypothetical protein [Clostridia bacterium]
MKLGVCDNVDRFLTLKRDYPDCPVDYLELSAQKIAKMDEAEYVAFCERVARENVPLYSASGLVPAEIRLDGDGLAPDAPKA